MSKPKHSATEVPADEMWWFLLTTCRYAFGRISYAAGMVSDLVRKYRGCLTDEQADQLAREIRQSMRLQETIATVNCDPSRAPADIMRTWEALATWLETP